MAKTQQRLRRADAPVLLPELIREILSWVPIKSLMRFRCVSKTWNSLIPELIREILSWVPIKSLMRFRCVSKTWNSLMFDPTFVKLHHQRSSKNTHLLVEFFCRETSKNCLTTCTIRRLFENPSFTVEDDCDQIDHHYLIGGSCNGLVCLMELDRPEDKEFRLWFRFWNPATRIMSEDSPHLSAPVPFGHFLKYGFGYDTWSDTYKVVIFLLDAKSENWVVKVHCLGDTCWRYILTYPANPMVGESDGQFACGSVNWLEIQKSGYDYQWETDTVGQLAILSFDLNKETYKYFLMPDGLSEVSFDDLRLGVLKGCLCLSQDDGGTHFAIWLMREFGVEKSWTQLLNVPYELPRVFSFPPSLKPVCISENDDTLLLADYSIDKFMLCNLRDNRIERAEDFKDQAPLSSHDYVPSLVLPYRN